MKASDPAPVGTDDDPALAAWRPPMPDDQIPQPTAFAAPGWDALTPSQREAVAALMRVPYLTRRTRHLVLADLGLMPEDRRYQEMLPMPEATHAR